MSVGIFTELLQYFPKNREKKKHCQNPVVGYLKTNKERKRSPMAIKPEGRDGGGVMPRFFLRLPLMIIIMKKNNNNNTAATASIIYYPLSIIHCLFKYFL